MPTYTYRESFLAEFMRLPPALRTQFMAAVKLLVIDLNSAGRPRPSLRIKRVRRQKGVWEITWAPDGRATFEYGAELIPGQPHIVWRRIGSHEILENP